MIFVSAGFLRPQNTNLTYASLSLAWSFLLLSSQLMAALSNPKVMAAMQGMMSGGAPDMAKMQELMAAGSKC